MIKNCIFSSPASFFLVTPVFSSPQPPPTAWPPSSWWWTSSACLAGPPSSPPPSSPLCKTTLSSPSMYSGQCHIETMLRFPLLVTCHTFYHDESESNEASPLSTITNLLLKHRPCTVHQRFVSGPEVILYTEIQWLLWMSCL